MMKMKIRRVMKYKDEEYGESVVDLLISEESGRPRMLCGWSFCFQERCI